MKTYVITGATSGIGEGLIRSFEGESVHVYALGRSQEKLERLKQSLIGKIQIDTVLVELSNVSSIKDSISSILNDKIEGFIHCAGVERLVTLRKTKYEDFIRLMNVNFFSFVEILRLLLSGKDKTSQFRVVALSSVASLRSSYGNAMYSASKGALDSYVRSISQGLIENNVEVNTIQPVFVDTPMIQNIKDSYKENYESFINSLQPQGILSVDDVVEQIRFMLYKKSTKVTGTAIYLNAGKI